MKLDILLEQKADTIAMATVLRYLSRKLGAALIKVPGVEKYKNPKEFGIGVKFIRKGTTQCIRFNWKTESLLNRAFAIQSVDIFFEKQRYTFRIEGMPIVKALPMLVKAINKPALYSDKILPVSAEEIITEDIILTENIRTVDSFDETIDEFFLSLKKGESYSRSDFAKKFESAHLGIFDAVVENLKSTFNVTGGKISAPEDADFEHAKSMLKKIAGSVELTRFTGKENYFQTEQEKEATENQRVSYEDSLDHLSELLQGLIGGAFNALFITGRGGVGKTQTVENVLAANGLRDGKGYFKNVGTASASGIYTLLYRHRKDIIVFDDSDGALADQDARNLIKAATDTKPKRKLVWNKKSPFIFDPEEIDPVFYEDDLTMAPKYFNFEGRIIFISNLSLDRLDPDGAIRTRAFIISLDPTHDEIIAFMEKILMDIKVEGSNKISKNERLEVLEVVKNSKRKSDISLRKLVRALNLAASGAPNWRTLVDLYA